MIACPNCGTEAKIGDVKAPVRYVGPKYWNKEKYIKPKKFISKDK